MTTEAAAAAAAAAADVDATTCAGGLRQRLAAVLPRGRRFRLHHVSTPPFKTDALCSPPPNEQPDRTYCEKHFLTVSIDAPPPRPREVLVLGLEIFIYTTAHVTTLFVSKADSTGLLDLLGLPRGTPSPIRQVCGAFAAYLVEARRRQGVPVVVSLFARAQNQYLFPGSVDYPGKHVLDDRGLVRWWCRTLDPLIAQPPVAAGATPWGRVRGYLVVPGLDVHETRALVPRAADETPSPRWSLDHPLERISHYSREFDWVPPRCLIPRFPDDPKSRFRDELDDEAARSGAMQTTGSWKSVRTLDMFWEMMAFRQECSSGRMTGFIWVVFEDEAGAPARHVAEAPSTPETLRKAKATPNVAPKTTPKKLFPSKAGSAEAAPPGGADSKADDGQKAESDKQDRKRKRMKKTAKEKRAKAKLRGPIRPRQPRVKTEQRNYLVNRPISSKYYYWPAQGSGGRIVSESDYKRVTELLLHLDFSTLDKAAGSSRRWIAEAGMSGSGGGGGGWGLDVTGDMDDAALSERRGETAAAAVNNLSGLVKRKRADAAEGKGEGARGAPAVTVLGAGLVRRKPKPEGET